MSALPSSPSSPARLAWFYRCAVAVRVLVAVFGGYALAYAFAACSAVWLPLKRGEAAVTASLLAILVYGIAALWVFTPRRAWQAALAITAATALLAALAWLGGMR